MCVVIVVVEKSQITNKEHWNQIQSSNIESHSLIFVLFYFTFSSDFFLSIVFCSFERHYYFSMLKTFLCPPYFYFSLIANYSSKLANLEAFNCFFLQIIPFIYFNDILFEYLIIFNALFSVVLFVLPARVHSSNTSWSKSIDRSVVRN